MDDHRWETEALRSGRARKGGRPTVSQDRRPVSTEPAVWVTLKEASDATGIPVGTLGSWARRGTVDSYLEGNGGRNLRIVDLNAVRGRAHDLGRQLIASPSGGGASRSEAEGVKPPSRQRSDPPPGPGGPDSPMRGNQMTETMIVPLDAWNKMLNQLGNLHEAGQQLADARERAAKAETEATFLRERLAELRSFASPSGGGAEQMRVDRSTQSSPQTESRSIDPHSKAEGVKPMERPLSDPPPGPSGPYSPLMGEQKPESEPWMPATVEPEPIVEAPATPRTVKLWRYLSDAWKSRGR